MWRRHVWLWQTVRIVIGLGLGASAVAVIAGRRGELSGAASLLSNLHWGWLALAVPAEIASLLAFAATERKMLRVGQVPIGMTSLAGIAVAGNAIQNSLPGGVAWASIFAFRQFRRRGADEVLAAWTVMAVGVVSVIGLAVVAAVGFLIASGQGAPLDLLEVIAVVVVLAAGVAVIVHRESPASATAIGVLATSLHASQRLFRRPRGDATAVAEKVWGRLTTVTPSPREWAVATGLSLANWSFDCLCLAIAFLAVGADVPVRGLLLAYGAGQLASTLPFTPGGLGVVEGSLAIALVAYGGSGSSTVAAVLLYRIISFWLLLPIGWGAWATLSWAGRRQDAELVTTS